MWLALMRKYEEQDWLSDGPVTIVTGDNLLADVDNLFGRG